MAAGRFVVLEGVDGSGKSTQARRLAEWLRSRGARVVETREPTGGEWGRRYRAWARGELEAGPEEVLRFFVEDRREHVATTIAPALASGSWVVCDRYVASTLAYQGAHGADRDAIRRSVEAERFPEPDLVLWLRLPVAEALARLGDAASERYEQRAFLERVDAAYASLGLTEVDATGTEAQVADRLRKMVSPLLDAGG